MAPRPKKAKRAVVDLVSAHPRQIAGRYEAAQKTTENANLWTLVDSLSAAAANSPSVRQILRDRSRYEYSNSPDVQAVASAYVADYIGDRIGLQLGHDPLSTIVEGEFAGWMRRGKIMAKLRTMALATYKDGESFAPFITNPNLPHSVKLDIMPLEAEMIASFWTGAIALQRNEVDGIRFDEHRNPTEYRILRQHPGDYRTTWKVGKAGGDWTDARYVLHMQNWSKLRPGQVRGVPETTSILSIPGLLRQYIMATITAAKTAAELAGVMQTDLVPEIDGSKTAAELAALASIDIQRGTLVSLPEGWSLSQMKAEQPTANFKEFCDFLKSHIGRPSNMPRNVAIGDSSDYNYASGRLDHQMWDRCQAVQRDDLSTNILDRLYAAFIEELIPVLRARGTRITKPEEDRLLAQIPEWYFRRRKHVDPAKEANADHTRLGDMTQTLGDYWAEQGEDGGRKTNEWLDERIEIEKTWNLKRTAAGLDPAPLPVVAQSILQPDEPDEPAKVKPDET